MDDLREKLKVNGWSEDELMYEEDLPIKEGKGKFKASVLLVHNSYLFGIVQNVPSDVQVGDFVKDLRSTLSEFKLNYFFIYLNGAIYLIEKDGSVNLDSPVNVNLKQMMSDMSQVVGRAVDMDPRFAKPGIRLVTHLRVPQLFAISNTLDAIVSGQATALVVMAVGLGKTYVQIVVVSKLFAANCIRSALSIAPSLAIASQAKNTYAQAGINAYELNKDFEFRAGLGITTVQRFFSEVGKKKNSEKHELPVELIIVDEPAIFETPARLGLLKKIERKILLGFSVVEASVGPFLGKTTYKYKSSNVVDDLIVPSGFRAHELGTLAEIVSGLRIGGESEGSVKDILTEQAYVISVRDIDDKGKILYQEKEQVAVSRIERSRIVKGDILISAAGVRRKVAYFNEIPETTVVFTSALIRIRAIEPSVSQHLYDFLSSSLGNAIIDRISYGTVQKHLNITALMSAHVYLPENIDVIKERKSDAVETGGDPVEFRKESSVIETLKIEIIPKLEAILKRPEGSASDDVNIIADVASTLKRLSVDLGGRSLEEYVLDSFPFPIALAYRRFRDAKFNVFERVLRLRDLAESCSFFVYNVFLMDYFRNLKTAGYVIQDKGARKAFSGFSMAARIDFVSELLQQRNDGRVNNLFLDELCRYDRFSTISRALNEDLRNSISHTAAASESQQERILEEFTSVIHEMLEKLKFLTQYRLVRIPSYCVRDHKIFRRLEVYSGVSHYFDEEEIETAQINADIGEDHLVLLNPEGGQLNLFPLYQLISNADTRHENHFCIFKQRRNNILQGESLPGSFEIELIGEEYFSNFLSSTEI